MRLLFRLFSFLHPRIKMRFIASVSVLFQSGWVTRMRSDEHVKRCLSPLEDHVNYLVTHKAGIVAAQKRNAQKSSVDNAD